MIDQKFIRNFSIIAHIDHGKSTLSDRLIEKCDAVEQRIMEDQILDDMDLKEEGRFKMNPPLRSAEDKAALIEGILDGTIDMIATDHAPHSAEEKGKGLAGSAFGIVGIETAFPLMYTHFVKTGIMSMERLMDLLVYNARERFGIPMGCDFSVWDLQKEITVEPERFVSKGHATPFAGDKLFGECICTVVDGKIVFKR